MRQSPQTPLQELARIQDRMNQLFEAALGGTNFDADGLHTWSPTADVFETGAELVISLELAGVEQDAIDLRVEGDELIVEGERRLHRQADNEHFHRVERSYGRFSRRFALPSTVDRQAIAALYRQGVLRVALPKRPGGESGPIKVSIG